MNLVTRDIKKMRELQCDIFCWVVTRLEYPSCIYAGFFLPFISTKYQPFMLFDREFFAESLDIK